MAQKIRVGIIGAGNFTTGRLLPNLKKLPDVEVTMVANRRRETAEKVASRFDIPHVAENYQEVVASDDVDAVLIGTTPYLHHDAVIAALEANKHVLCQTRMATTVAEAKEMLAAAEAAKARGIRSALMPATTMYEGTKYVKHLIDSGYVGKVRHVMIFSLSDARIDLNSPRAIRTPDVYGKYSPLQIGLFYDVLGRFFGPATSVIAQHATYIPERPRTPGGPLEKSPYPDEMTIVADTASGAVVMNCQNYMVLHPESRLEIYGSEGSLIYRINEEQLLGGQVGDKELKPMAIPPEHQNPWLVEETFIKLCRGEIEDTDFTFYDGLRHMEYQEATYQAAMEGRRVDLPK